MLRILDVKNINKRKNRLTPVKLGSKKQHKKFLASREGSGGKSPSNDRKKPRPTYIIRFTHILSNSVLCRHDKKFKISNDFRSF